jgi:hypothetical protein
MYDREDNGNSPALGVHILLPHWTGQDIQSARMIMYCHDPDYIVSVTQRLQSGNRLCDSSPRLCVYCNMLRFDRHCACTTSGPSMAGILTQMVNGVADRIADYALTQCWTVQG